MGIAKSLIKGMKERVLARYGERLVTNLADTSSDAPNKFAEPKRDLYDKLKSEGQLGDGDKKDR
jgi:hypothetical protein